MAGETSCPLKYTPLYSPRRWMRAFVGGIFARVSSNSCSVKTKVSVNLLYFTDAFRSGLSVNEK